MVVDLEVAVSKPTPSLSGDNQELHHEEQPHICQVCVHATAKCRKLLAVVGDAKRTILGSQEQEEILATIFYSIFTYFFLIKNKNSE